MIYYSVFSRPVDCFSFKILRNPRLPQNMFLVDIKIYW